MCHAKYDDGTVAHVCPIRTFSQGFPNQSVIERLDGHHLNRRAHVTHVQRLDELDCLLQERESLLIYGRHGKLRKLSAAQFLPVLCRGKEILELVHQTANRAELIFGNGPEMVGVRLPGKLL